MSVRVEVDQRYVTAGPLAGDFPTFYEVTSVSHDLGVACEVQEVDGVIVGSVRIHIADLVAAIGQGWLRLVESEATT